MSCRYTLDVLIAGEDAAFDRKRHLAETCLIVFGSLAVALAFPTGAEKIFAVTGKSTPKGLLLTVGMPPSTHISLTIPSCPVCKYTVSAKGCTILRVRDQDMSAIHACSFTIQRLLQELQLCALSVM